MLDQVFDLLAAGLAEIGDVAEIDGEALDQGGIQVMLTDEQAEAIAEFRLAIPVTTAITADGVRWDSL